MACVSETTCQGNNLNTTLQQLPFNENSACNVSGPACIQSAHTVYLLSCIAEAGAEDACTSDAPDRQQPAAALQLGSVEPHWRTETDYYAATVALDFLAFAFVALFYQASLPA